MDELRQHDGPWFFCRIAIARTTSSAGMLASISSARGLRPRATCRRGLRSDRDRLRRVTPSSDEGSTTPAGASDLLFILNDNQMSSRPTCAMHTTRRHAHESLTPDKSQIVLTGHIRVA